MEMERFINQIICGDSLQILKQIPDNSIDIIITSPPYNFNIDYGGFNDKQNWNDYFDFLFNIFNECIRVLKSAGRICINIQPKNSDYMPTHHKISQFFLEKGLIWKDELIWNKNNFAVPPYYYGKWKSALCPMIRYSWEFIEVFCKDTIERQCDVKNIDITKNELQKWTDGRWSIQPAIGMKKTYNHNAMYPEELVVRLLKLYSCKNDIVLDPFNGVGTTTKVAKQLYRQYIGIDISEDYCQKAIQRLKINNYMF